MNLETPDYLKNANLNDEQYKAVTNINGPIVVCAGAGSGKTRVIAYRTLHLVKELKINPLSITCVTFTNKAAKEMKNRISLLLKDEDCLPIVTTFHGYGIKIIRKYGHYIGIEDLVIIDEDEQKIIIDQILKDHINDKAYTAKKVLSYISLKSNGFLDNEDEYSTKNVFVFEEIIKFYENHKKQYRYMDFNDILIHALSLIKISSVKNSIRDATKHFLVDEYQDTNLIQHEIIKTICNQGNELIVNSLFVVGDEDQSIYSWRGANIQNIVNFKNDFENTKLITLNRNYRSVKPILNFANNIIEKNSYRNSKHLWTDKNTETGVIIFEYLNGYKEAEGTVRIIQSLKISNKLKSCAILYRSHHQSRPFEEELIKNNIRYKIYGAINFYDRQEIKDILSYLKLFINKYDVTSFIRCCNLPNRGFGETSLNKFLEFFNNNIGKTIEDTIFEYLNTDEVSQKIKTSLLTFLDILNSLEIYKNSPYRAISHIVSKTGYISYLEKTESDLERLKERKENVGELIEAAKNFELTHSSSIYDFIDHIFILDEKDNNLDESEINLPSPIILMSIHAAKGLEFSTVFIVGLEDGIFPSQRSITSLNSLEEERRLFYVAITRAEDNLYCSYVRNRNLWGYTRIQNKSSFISNVSDNVSLINVSNIPMYMIDKFIYMSKTELLNFI